MEPSDTPVEPTADRSRAPATSPPRASPRIWWIVVAAIVLNLLVVSIFSSDETGTDVPYSVHARDVPLDTDTDERVDM